MVLFGLWWVKETVETETERNPPPPKKKYDRSCLQQSGEKNNNICYRQSLGDFQRKKIIWKEMYVESISDKKNLIFF